MNNIILTRYIEMQIQIQIEIQNTKLAELGPKVRSSLTEVETGTETLLFAAWDIHI